MRGGVAVAVLVVLALALAACGETKTASRKGGSLRGGHVATTTNSTAATPTTSATTVPTKTAPSSTVSGAGATSTTQGVTATTSSATARPTTSTAPVTPSTLAGGQPAGGPVPAGFDPVSFTAVSASEFWLLGEAPCPSAVCTSIVRTTNGGASFVGIPAPVAPLDLGPSSTGKVNTLRFADPLDGYAYATHAVGAFWDTHDGGEHWAEPSFGAGRELLAFGSGAGYAFALVGNCQQGSCTSMVLERSPVGSDSWTPLNLPVTAGADPYLTMAVHGANLWISVTTSQSSPNQLLVVGTGAGASFTTYRSPCYSGLGGKLEAASSEAVWAACPTGMLAGLWRSDDGGAHWKQLTSAPELPNSAMVAPASASTAVVAPDPHGGLLVTTDGGATWRTVSAGSAGYTWSWVGFTDATTGSALQFEGQVPAGWPWPNGPFPEQLWRTTDGGLTWSVRMPPGGDVAGT